ncbi:MAG: Gfo/Idh/MocA family oxidoreductase [Muribaculaceae bacterium]|nr:Gfo/Idh/MocA family oxidoreductase [Muribaculaceae bacterium]
MKLKAFINYVILASVVSACHSGDSKSSIQPIKTEIPPRPEGTTDLIGFASEPIETVGVGFVGLGMRGSDAVIRYLSVPGSKIVALCDIEKNRVNEVQKELNEKAPDLTPATYSGEMESWKGLCENPDVDLVYIATDWKNHAPIALYAMEQGKHVAIEVPAALTLEEIWSLVNKAEEKRLHCMMLENCVYDDFEMNTLNMAQKGLFGEVLHVEGSYIHNLSDFWDEYWNDWRMDYNSKNRGDVYPTHGTGPACQLLDMHRGDKMNTLVAMDTKSVGAKDWLEKHRGERPEEFANGDHTMTMIRTENGKTIHIQHDVVNPRPYTRMYQLTGTKGFANKYPNQGYAFEPEQFANDSLPSYENLSAHRYLSDEQKDELTKLYQHPILKEVGGIAKQVGGHGGMDYIMDYRLIYCLNNGLPLDMDVYDLAEWCSLAPLSAISIENGSAPVEVPDFTRGSWNKQKGYRHAFKQ